MATLKIDDNLLQQIGLGALPVEEKRGLLGHIYETLEMRVGMRLADQMTNEQLDEFEQYFEAKDDAGAFKWLETNFPNYKDIVNEEFEKLRSEVAANAPQILAAAQSRAANPQQAMNAPQVGGLPPQAPQGQGQPYAPQPMPAQPYAPPADPYQPPQPAPDPANQGFGPQPAYGAPAQQYQPAPPQPSSQPFDQPQPMPMQPPAPAPAPASPPVAEPWPPVQQPQASPDVGMQSAPPQPGFPPADQPLPSATPPPANDQPLPPQPPPGPAPSQPQQ